MATIPDELILDILLRLPVSSLVRLRRVCNSWKTLISSPQFANEHLQRSLALGLAPSRLAYYTEIIFDNRIGVLPVQPLIKGSSGPTTKVITLQDHHSHILCSCNGLLVVRDDALSRCSYVRLWNPCTGLTSQFLDFDHFFLFWGFGYDHVHDQYKLLGAGNKVGAKILTFGSNSNSNSNSWRTIQDPPIYTLDSEGKFVRGTGTLNWMVPNLVKDSFILSFDLINETFGTVSLPPHMNGDVLILQTPRIAVLRDCLAVCFNHKQTHWAVWLMKEYGVHESWTRLAMIPHCAEIVHYPSYLSLLPLYISEDDVLLAVPPSKRLFLYNLKDARLDFPMVDSSSDGMKECPMSKGTRLRIFCVFHESLLSPSHIGLRSYFFKMPSVDWLV